MCVHVVADLVLLYTPTLFLDQLLDYETANSVAGIALLCVRLDDHAAVDQRCVVILVLACKVRVNGVTHVGADQEGPRNGLRVSCRSRGETLQKERYEGRLGTRRGYRANLLMVEESDTVHISLEYVEV